FLREALHMFGLFGQEGLRDEQGEIGVPVSGLFEHPVEHGPHVLPQLVPICPNHHTTANGRIVCPLRVLYDIDVPLRVVGIAPGDYVGHSIQSVMSIGYKNRRRKAAGGISRRTMQSGPMFVLQYIPPAETQPDRAIEASIKTLLLVAI